jgi:hypothetical protein
MERDPTSSASWRRPRDSGSAIGRQWWLLGVTLLLFQSHWIDDVGSGSSDTAGIAVSVLGSGLVAIGAATRRRIWGRILLGLGLLFIIMVSVADLTGIGPDGSMTANLSHHLVAELGLVATAAVTVTLVAAAVSLVGVLRASP